MLGDALLYAASRATSNAVDSMSRNATWYIIATTFLICGLVFGLVLAFWLLEPEVGAFLAAAYIAAGCALVGVVCLLVPTLARWLEAATPQSESPVAATMAVVDEEAREAVDYFGALQVVGSAFMLGVGTARRLKG